MADKPRTTRPASERLELELKRVIKEQGLVIWLDADSHYTAFVKGLAERSKSGEVPFPVVRFEGSFLELMLALEKYENDLYPDKLLIHMPGFNEQSIAETPLYELFKAGKRYRKALDTLIEEACVGVVRPEQGKAFRDNKPSLEDADAWLAQAHVSEQDRFLIALSAHRTETVVTELFTKNSRLLDDLKEPVHRAQFVDYLRKSVGMPATWPAFVLAKWDEVEGVAVADVPFLVASWLMAVEFVSDLAEPPVMQELAVVRQREKTTLQACRSLVELIRAQFAEDYRTLSGQFEDMLGQERQGHQPEALGSIDTFRFEERAIRGAALSAVQLARWDAASRYAAERKPEASFWVRQDKALERTWELIHLAAGVGRELKNGEKKLQRCGSLEEATNRYRDNLYRVDHAHRQFEQRFHTSFTTDLEDEAALREAREAVRSEYRKWADALAGEFAKLCEEFGPLPSADLRQRHVYEQFVHPLIEGGERVAFFMVDALRYEMAQDLKEHFESKKYTVSLHARLAELPTVTEVGMNALAPVAHQGRLRPVVKERAFHGFRSGHQFTVTLPADRVRAMATRSVAGKAIDFELAEFAHLSEKDLKKKLSAGSALIVVRSLELDSAGEKGFLLGTVEHSLAQIREAVQRLQQQGIAQFVLAADHGYLLQDSTAKLIEYKDAPNRRHVFSSGPSGMADALEIPLSALDYDVDAEAYLVFRRDTAIWKVQEKVAPFVHGGNTLQERVIPVLTLEKKNKAGSSIAQYEVVATALAASGRRERLELRVRLQKHSIGELSYGGAKKISLALRVLGRDGAVLEVLPQILEVSPPGELEARTIVVPPGADAATVVFELEGDTDEKVRIEVYHPDGTEKVTSKIVEGWFDMHRSRKLGRPTEGEPPSGRLPPSSRQSPSSRPVSPTQGSLPTQSESGMVEQQKAAEAADWADGIEHEGFRRAFQIIEAQGAINEIDLHQVIGPRMARVFSRQFDVIRRKVPFEVEIRISSGMKVYVKGEMR